MSKFREILQNSLRHAESGNIDAALSGLEQGIAEAADDGEVEWAALLSKNAALLLEREKQLDRAEGMYRAAASYDESDGYLQYALAQICKKLGKGHDAKRHLDQSFLLAKEQGDDDLLRILEREDL